MNTLIEIVAAMGTGIFIAIIAIGVIMIYDMIYDSPRRRLERASKKYKEENEQYNKR